MGKLTRWAMTITGAMLLAETASAGYMRCKGHIIEDGLNNTYTMYEVLKKCGEPTERYGNTWIYAGSSKFTRTLRFRSDGRLLSIRK